MDSCCDKKSTEMDALRVRQGSVLKMVLGINAGMFLVEIVAGLLAASTALLGDSLDMLGDTLVYGLSLYVIARSEKWRASAALLKGAVMGAFGIGVLADALYKTVFSPAVPAAEIIGAVGLLALLANTACFILLRRHAQDDLNMRSTWLCSRNDVIANVAVLLAGGGVWITRSPWPDILVGSVIAALFLGSAWQVMRGAVRELRTVVA